MAKKGMFGWLGFGRNKEQDKEQQAELERLASEQAAADAAQAEQARLASEQVAAAQESAEEPGKKAGFFARLKEGLRRTKENFGSGFLNLFKGKKIDDDLFDELEEQLLIADVGVDTTLKIIKSLIESASRKQLKDGEALYQILQQNET